MTIIVIKTARKQIHFLSNFLVVVPLLDLKVANVNPSTSTLCTPRLVTTAGIYRGNPMMLPFK